jgi:hypothetical protein
MGLVEVSGRMVQRKRTRLSAKPSSARTGSFYQVDETSKVVAIVRIWHSALGAPEF